MLDVIYLIGTVAFFVLMQVYAADPQPLGESSDIEDPAEKRSHER